MFPRVKVSGKYRYLQIVENRRVNGTHKQQVIASLGRMDELRPLIVISLPSSSADVAHSSIRL